MLPQIIPLKDRTDLRGIQQNSGARDYSRLSCAAGKMPLVSRAAEIFSKRYVPKLAVERHRCKVRNWPRFLPIQRCSAAGGQTSNTIVHFALDFERKESVCDLCRQGCFVSRLRSVAQME
jgi:hypothetical protein